jgi:hypothetical protein
MFKGHTHDSRVEGFMTDALLPCFTILVLSGCAARVTVDDHGSDAGSRDARVSVTEPPPPAESDGAAPDAKPSEADQLARESSACVLYARAQCERMETCNGMDAADCGNMGYSCPWALFSAGSTRTVENVLDCASRFATWSCDDIRTGKDLDCMTPGTRALGQACIYGAECQSSHCLVAGNGCGSCQNMALPGGACDATTACPEGQTCSAGTCSTPPAPVYPKAGEACKPGDACDTSLYCQTSAPGGASVCVPLVAENSPCDTFFSCAQGLYCSSSHQCRRLPSSGEACAMNVSGNATCGDGLRCFSQQCLPPGKEGDSCDGRVGGFTTQCAPGLQCDCRGADCTQHYCEEARYEFEPCDDTHVCAVGLGLLCIDGTCKNQGRSTTTCK